MSYRFDDYGINWEYKQILNFVSAILSFTEYILNKFDNEDLFLDFCKAVTYALLLGKLRHYEKKIALMFHVLLLKYDTLHIL